jgi:hypothetical protein
MIRHSDIEPAALRSMIKAGIIQFAGYLPGKIYGRLGCKGGKRMKRENRVFFTTEDEAIHLGFRPCGNCMRQRYRAWKTLDDWPPDYTIVNLDFKGFRDY